MLDSTKRLRLWGLGLLALQVFLALSIFTYDPADPPTALVYPAHEETANVCGPLGAIVARALLNTFGIGAYLVLVTGVGIGVTLLRGRTLDQPLLRLSGWLLLLSGVTTLAALAGQSLSPGPVIGPGGYLGAAGRGLAESQFATAGAYVVTLSAVLGGLLLCADALVFQVAGWSLFASRKMAGVMATIVRRRAESNGKSTSKERAATSNEDSDDDAIPINQKSRIARSKNDLPSAGLAKAPATSTQLGSPKLAEGQSDEADEDEADSPEDASETGETADSIRIKNRLTKLTERQAVFAQLEAASQPEDAAEYELPSMNLLLESEVFCFEEQEQEVRRKAKILEKTFGNFGFNVKVVEIETGPVISQYEVELEAGLRVSKITGLADDLAVALRVPSVRIVAPIPGKNTVGIEVPNGDRQMVRLREVMEEAAEPASRCRIPIYLGKDVSGNPMVVDLSSMPHLLIAGRTGTGKSVCLNTILMSLLMTRRPDEVKMLLIDPKMVELTPYARLPHLMHPVVTDMKKAEAILGWAVDKMEERYALLMRAGVRHIDGYNQLSEEELMERLQPESEEEQSQIPTHLPYIVIMADEFADLIMTSPKEVESHIIRLAQKSRAVGIHLILATQKPTVNVITGLIKSNLPARIAFQVASRTDSRVVLDEMGAEKLLGMGDLLFLSPGTSLLLRGQGCYVSDDEIRNVVGFLATNEPQFAMELVQLKPKSAEGSSVGLTDHRDELYGAAVDLVVREGRGSVSLLQRALGIGYGRGARLIDYMADDGIVGPYNGSQARDVLISLNEWEARLLSAAEKTEAPKPRATAKPKHKSNRLVLKSPARYDDDADEEDPPFDEDDEQDDEQDGDFEEAEDYDEVDERNDERAETA